MIIINIFLFLNLFISLSFTLSVSFKNKKINPIISNCHYNSSLSLSLSQTRKIKSVQLPIIIYLSLFLSLIQKPKQNETNHSNFAKCKICILKN